MKKQMRFFIFLLTPLLFSNCSTSYYYANFVVPAEVYIPADVKTIRLVNRSEGNNETNYYKINGQAVENLKGVATSTANEAIKVLREQIEKFNRYSIVESTQQIVKPNNGFPAEVLKTEEILKLCTKDKVDALIAIDGVDLSINTNGEVEFIPAVDYYGNPVSVPQFNSEREVDLSIAWRMYDCKKVIVGDEWIDYERMSFTKSGYSEDQSYNQLPTKSGSISDIAKVAAINYASRISPHRLGAYRKYFDSGSEKLIAAGQLVRLDENWEKATEIWSLAANSKILKESTRAQFNLALAAEMLGKPEISKVWIDKALLTTDKKIFKDYATEIEKQILIKKVVEKQVGNASF
jgi:Family of unknown function (DUF6340)